jgi:hypothetical protein
MVDTCQSPRYSDASEVKVSFHAAKRNRGLTCNEHPGPLRDLPEASQTAPGLFRHRINGWRLSQKYSFRISCKTTRTSQP